MVGMEVDIEVGMAEVIGAGTAEATEADILVGTAVDIAGTLVDTAVDIKGISVGIALDTATVTLVGIEVLIMVAVTSWVVVMVDMVWADMDSVGMALVTAPIIGIHISTFMSLRCTAALVIQHTMLRMSTPVCIRQAIALRVDAAPVLIDPVPAGAKQQAVARPATTAEGEAFRLKAEAAFLAGDFQRAARMANHALVEMPRDGKLLLFAAQTSKRSRGDSPSHPAARLEAVGLCRRKLQTILSRTYLRRPNESAERVS